MRRAAALLALALGAALGAAPETARAQGGAPGAVPVQRGWTAAPDTVTVGPPFRVILRVRAPLGAEVVFPEAPDSTGTIELVDPRQVATAPDTGALDQTATYRVVAWDVERQPIPLPDVVVRLDGVERRVPFSDVAVFVASVLPADSAARVPRPARPIFEFGRPWWHWLVLGLLALGIIGLLWWLWRRRRRGRAALAADPFAEAEEEFARVERRRLVEAGERSRYVALMVEVLRAYLARVSARAPTSLTTSELLHAVRDEPVPTSRLATLLAEADLIKFAARPVAADRARELGAEARAIVATVHEERQARLAAERAAAAEPERRAA